MSEQLGSRKGLQTKDIVLCGILMALTTVMTMIVQIPVIGAHGYVNMGDTVVLFTALYLGKKEGAIVGGLGSALADLISGYGVYAPVTLIAKGLEGFVCGLIADKVSGGGDHYQLGLRGRYLNVIYQNQSSKTWTGFLLGLLP